MIKTVLFDLGNVILPFDVTRLANRLAAHSPRKAEEIIDLLWNEHIANTFETGRMSPQEYFQHVSVSCDFSDLDYSRFVPIFNDIFVEDADVAALIGSLKKNYSLGLISNTNAIHVEHILRAYPTLKKFDHLWFSNEAGLRKPDPAIYRLALDHFSIQPSEAVFIDDMPINIAAANDMGINGILYQGSQQLRRDLTELGVHY